LVQLFGNYFKANLILQGKQKTFALLKQTFQFIRKNIFSAVGLYYLIFISLILFFLIFLWGNKILGSSEGKIILILNFLFQQIFVLLVSFYQILFYSAQMELVHRAGFNSNSEDEKGEI
jgi:hypothetical protein